MVLLSPYPFFRLFSDLLDLVAPEYFEHGPPGLEAACHDLDQWPAPRCEESLLLPAVGRVLQVQLPVRADLPRSAAARPSNASADVPPNERVPVPPPESLDVEGTADSVEKEVRRFLGI